MMYCYQGVNSDIQKYLRVILMGNKSLTEVFWKGQQPGRLSPGIGNCFLVITKP